ncbi:MAG: sugar porter family MFS transporter [archaeon]|nr:sugar porter family MFS transporter [archaeon]
MANTKKDSMIEMSNINNNSKIGLLDKSQEKVPLKDKDIIENPEGKRLLKYRDNPEKNLNVGNNATRSKYDVEIIREDYVTDELTVEYTEKEIQKIIDEDNAKLKSDKEYISKIVKKNPEVKDLYKYMEVSIEQPVNDIYKIASRNHNINNMYFTLIIIIGIFSTFFTLYEMFIITYLRPIDLVNQLKCYDPILNSFTNCIYDYYNFCYCGFKPNNKCGLVCDDVDDSNCIKKFKDALSAYVSSNVYGHRKFIKIFEKEEQSIALLQHIGQEFCYSYEVIIVLIVMFAVGGSFGFILTALLAEYNGKRITILICSIATWICSVGVIILNCWKIEEKFNMFFTFWSIDLFLLGFFFFPLENLLHLYALELSPETSNIKIINSLLFLKYAFALLIYFIYNGITKKYMYMFFIFSGMLLAFILCFIIFFPETPRYYSEQKDYRNKAKSLRMFINEHSVIWKNVKIPKIVAIDPKGGKKAKPIIEEPKNNKNQKGKKAQQPEPGTPPEKKEETETKVIFEEVSKINYLSRIHIFISNENAYKMDHDQLIIKSYFTKPIQLLKNDTYLCKKGHLFILCYFLLELCFNFNVVSLITNTENPNIGGDYNTTGTKVKMFIYIFLLLAAVLGLSFILFEIIDLDAIIIVFLFVYSICCLFFDFKESYIDRKIFYQIGTEEDRNLDNLNDILQATCFWMIVYIISIFDLMITLQVPTSYRTLFYFINKAFGNLTYIIAVMTVFFFNSPNFIAGLIGMSLFFFFGVLVIKFKFDMYGEQIDEQKNKKKSS